MTHCQHCGGLPDQKGPRRSTQDHRRFFGVINAALNQWPETHEFAPDDAEHLRAWLLCKAGYRETVSIPLEGDDPQTIRNAVAAVEAALKAAGAHAFVRPHPTGFVVFKAKSIAFDKCDQKAFVPVREAVEAVIEQELGVKADDLLREMETAA